MHLLPCKPGPALVFCSQALPLNIPSAYRTSPKHIEAKNIYLYEREKDISSFSCFQLFGILVAHHLDLKVHHLLV